MKILSNSGGIMKLLTTKRNEPDYKRNLKKFDMAVCEAISVSQEIAGQMVLPTVGYSTAVFTRMLAHAQTVVCTVRRADGSKGSLSIGMLLL
nr:hypothetical protein [uncultured Celeribacter sp.]